MNTKDLDWKKKISLLLKKEEIITDKFTGKIIINLNQGAVCNAQKNEFLK